MQVNVFGVGTAEILHMQQVHSRLRSKKVNKQEFPIYKAHLTALGHKMDK
jgi:hypothetical protein